VRERRTWPQLLADGRELAVIVATVDLERALGAGAFPPELADATVDDELLGARVAIVPTGGAELALAEPSTEGRLAGLLARRGEGDVGRYIEAPVTLGELNRLATDRGVLLSRPANGPFGRQVLVLGADPAGPQVLLVEPRSLPSLR
jgi:hypothetical protein